MIESNQKAITHSTKNNMKAKYLRTLLFPQHELSLNDLANRMEFWQYCTPQELRYGMKITHALAESKLV